MPAKKWIKPTREAHGVRPAYPTGSLVQVGKDIGIITEAQTNIDGGRWDWHDVPRPMTYGLPVGHSHAWRPQYSVDWVRGGRDLKDAWWTADEWDFVAINRAAARFGKTWPALLLHASDSDYASALT